MEIYALKRSEKMLLRCLGAGFLLLCVIISGKAFAESVYGKVTFVGTMGEFVKDSEYSAQFRFRISDSTCTGDDVKKDRWIVVRSGRMDGKFQHNMANFRNAYNTVMSSFLANTRIQVDGVPSCDSNETQIIWAWKSQIGIYR